jgi:hypothetical protein
MRAHPSIRILVTTLLPALALAGACGKLKPADMSGAAGMSGMAGTSGAGGAAGTTAKVLVTISGVAAPHPLNKALLGEDEPFSMLEVAIVDPSAVIVDQNAPPLGSMALDTSMGNCDMTGCKWQLMGVDITNPNLLGLVGTLQDTRTGDGGDARVWVKTGTGMGTMADLAGVRAAPAPITGRQAFAVSRKLEAALGMFVGKVLNQTFAPGDLEARGFLIGHVVDKLPADGSMPAAVAGAKVSTTGTPNFDVIYPAADFVSAGMSTSALGIFLMVPRTATAVVANWSVVPPAGDTRTWSPHLAGSNPQNAFIIILPAD